MATEPSLLSVMERDVITKLGDIWGDLCKITDHGPTREPDLNELVIHIHALQQAVLSQAAARAYPDEFRRLGSTLRRLNHNKRER